MQNWPTSPYIYPTPASPAEPVAASQARKLCAHPVATATTKQASARHMDCATEHVWSDDAAFSAYLYSPQHENTPRSDGCPCCWHLHLRPLEDCKWSARGGWDGRHWLALVMGLVGWYLLIWGPLVEFGVRLPSREGLTLANLVVMIALFVFDWRLKRRSGYSIAP